MSKTSTPITSSGLLGLRPEANKPASIVCLGELLWDLLPSGAQLGGAPANVAFHAARMGARAALISRVGADLRGRVALDALAQASIDVSCVQSDPQRETGKVLVTFHEGEPSYKICEDAAFDAIQLGDRERALVLSSDFLCLGTLAARVPAQAGALLGLLESLTTLMTGERPRIVVDLNLRPPHVDVGTVLSLVAHADILKLNAAEFAWLSRQLPGSPLDLLQTGQLRLLIVTRGDQGAELFSANHHVEQAAPRVDAGDPVGAGDAFLAAVCVGLAAGFGPEQVLAYAIKKGAEVAGEQGAMPGLVIPDSTGLSLS